MVTLPTLCILNDRPCIHLASNDMSIVSRFRGYVSAGRTTPERSVEEAYQAALAIRAIEEEHFQGQPISAQYGQYPENTMSYFQGELRKYLKIVRVNLGRFRTNRATLERDSLDKLQFSDQVINRYDGTKPNQALVDASRAMVPISASPTTTTNPRRPSLIQAQTELASTPKPKGSNLEALSDKTGLLPRSILGTLNRLKRDLDPEPDAQVMEKIRVNRAKTFIAIRFLLVLVTLTLFVQIGMRHVILSNQWPIGNRITQHYQNDNRIFINSELEEEALKELGHYEEKLKFKNMINEALNEEIEKKEALKEQLEKKEALNEKIEKKVRRAEPNETLRPILSGEEMEQKIRERAREVGQSFAFQSANAVKNWIADLAGLLMFGLILFNSRQEIEILKAFIDELVYGLSDSAKAFIIILFTDIFVGFHSPHGWEVLLEGVAQHFGVAPNHDFIFLFIATFPVILDTIFKYWIFRYLNRVSPSAVATYKNMNEG